MENPNTHGLVLSFYHLINFFLNLRVIIPCFRQFFLSLRTVSPQPRNNFNGNLVNGFLIELFVHPFLNSIVVISGGSEQSFTLRTVIPLAGKNLVSKLIYGFLDRLFLAVIGKADISVNIVSVYSVKSPLPHSLTIVVL